MFVQAGKTFLGLWILDGWRLHGVFNISLPILVLEYLVLILVIWGYRVWKNKHPK